MGLAKLCAAMATPAEMAGLLAGMEQECVALRCENARLRECMQEVAEELEALDEANAQIQAAVLRKCLAD